MPRKRYFTDPSSFKSTPKKKRQMESYGRSGRFSGAQGNGLDQTQRGRGFGRNHYAGRGANPAAFGPNSFGVAPNQAAFGMNPAGFGPNSFGVAPDQAAFGMNQGDPRMNHGGFGVNPGGSFGRPSDPFYSQRHGFDGERPMRGSRRGKGGRRDRSGYDREKRTDHAVGVSEGWLKDGDDRDSNRPPPHLKGREIGMWFARRSQARKEKEQKLNRSTVSLDSGKEKKIRDLLSTLQKKEGDESSPTERSSSSTTERKSQFKGWEPDSRSEWNDCRSAATSYPAATSSTVFAKVEGFAKSTTYVYQDKDSVDFTQDDGTPDSWESRDGDGQIKDIVKVKMEGEEFHRDPHIKKEVWSVSSEENGTVGTQYWSETTEIKSEETEGSLVDGTDDKIVHTVEVKKEVQETDPSPESVEEEEEVIDLDNYDDDGNAVPSIAGVVEYMKSHGDYPFAGDEAETDFISDAFVERGDTLLDQKLKDQIKTLESNSQYMRMITFRKKLPSYEMKQTIVEAVQNSQVLVISGETGCGKTTQVPQFILDDYIERGIGSQCRIICTQPRRISAISVAERVAAERCEKVDDSGSSSVGYQIRLETKRPRSEGSILFCTTGIVLKFLENDPFLERATHVIIDEIHERDLQSDFLMIILKDLLPRRPGLTVILMSATLNAEMFSQYFDACPMLNIPGYTFPVKEYLLEDCIEMTNFKPEASELASGFRRKPGKRQTPEEQEENANYQVWCRNLRDSYCNRTLDILQDFDYSQINLELINHIINHICTKMEDGAILVFVPGWEEIKKLNNMIHGTARCKSGALRVIPLHSLMPTVNQREVFERPPPGVRKIVIATNIAETSITIDDVVFVIDCGKIKVTGFRPEMNLSSLEAQWVSKANAKQRRGRAGRVQAGHCFHLYTKFHFDRSQDYLPPEMLRTRLEELCLKIKLLKLGRIVPFIGKAMQHPSIEAVTHAIETLIELNALDRNENLLPLGYHLARMPVEPHTGKMILFGAMFCCLDPILTVAASLSFKDAFVVPLGKEELADKARLRLAGNSKSDHIMLINAFKGWEESFHRGNNRSYCWENFLSENTLRMLKDMKRQLAELLCDLGFVSSRNPKDVRANKNCNRDKLIRAVLCAGLYPNVAQISKVPTGKKSWKRGVGMVLKDNTKVCTHPKSVNFTQTFFESKWMVFYHKLKTSKVYIHDSTMVSSYPLLFFGGDVGIVTEGDQQLVTVDDWVKFKSSESTAQLVKDLRQQLDKLLEKKIIHPGPMSWDVANTEGALMMAIADLLCMEDRPLGSEQGKDGSIGKPNTML